MSDDELTELLQIFKKIVGERVALERDRAGYTQSTLAEKMKPTRGALKEIERGSNAPSLKMILELSETMDVGPAVFFPSFVVSKGASDSEKELDAIAVALAKLPHEDIVTLRVCAEALREHRKSEKESE